MKKDDEKIKIALEKGTGRAAGKKAEVWDGINNKLSNNRRAGSSRRGASIIVKVAAAAAVLCIAGTVFFTSPGKAAVARVADLFAPKRTVDYSLEGMDESGEFSLHTGSTIQSTTPQPGNPTVTTEDTKPVMTYAMYIDETKYSFGSKDGADILTPLDYPSDYPDVYLKITQDTQHTAEEIAQDLEKNLSSQYEYFENVGHITDPVNSMKLHMRTGDKWDSEVTDYYIVDNTAGGAFIIEAKYFLEAEEGHGARFYYILQQFQVIPAQ